MRFEFCRYGPKVGAVKSPQWLNSFAYHYILDEHSNCGCNRKVALLLPKVRQQHSLEQKAAQNQSMRTHYNFQPNYVTLNLKTPWILALLNISTLLTNITPGFRVDTIEI